MLCALDPILFLCIKMLLVTEKVAFIKKRINFFAKVAIFFS